MKLYHATHVKNARSIERQGLLASCSTGKRPAVWGVARAQIDYAICHCLAKRHWRLSEIVVYELDVPASWVRKYAVSGVCYVPRDVPPARVRRYGSPRLIRCEE